MAFPFYFSAKFSSIEHPAYYFRQTDFLNLRDFVKRKFTDVHHEYHKFSFTLPRVFGVMNFSVQVKLTKGRVDYSIDMMPVLLTVVLLLFASLFISRGSIVLSLSLGAAALIFVYAFVLLIVNGMVRRVFEEFVVSDMERLQKEIENPRCVNCGQPMNPKQKVCTQCENSSSRQESFTINYTFTPDKKNS